MSKAHRHDDNCNCVDISNLLGTKLYGKIVNETNQAASDTERDILKIVRSALEARRGLIADELPASLSAEDRESALSELTWHHTRLTICTLMQLSATISVASGDSMPEYIGHTAKHWDDELQAEPFDEMVATLIQKAAVVQTGEHN